MDEMSSESLNDESQASRFLRSQSFFDKSFTIRVLICLCFAFLLFMFIHFRETYVEKLELGTDANRYIVAQVDFSFPDDEATIILRQEAAHSIGDIYRIKEEQIHEKINSFQKYITKDEQGSSEWNSISGGGGFEDVALVLNRLDEGLKSSRFTNGKTIQRIDTLSKEELPTERQNFYFYVPAGDSGPLPIAFWMHLIRSSFKNVTISPALTLFIVRYFENINWDFESDQGTEYTLRKLMQSRIPEKYTSVRSGDRLIDKGEKVSARHISMLQALKESVRKKHNFLDPLMILGSLFMTIIIMTISAFYLRENHNNIVRSNRKLSLFVTIISLSLLFAKCSEHLLIQTSTNLIDLVRFPIFVPFAVLLVTSLINARLGAFVAIFLSIIFAMSLAVESMPFIIVNIATSLIILFTTRVLKRRKDVFIICAKAWFASVIVVISFNLYSDSISFLNFVGDLVSTLFFMGITAILVVGLLPVFESVFQIMTDITLMEFMDPTNELLRRLTIEAPGTYQHSIIVGHLAEAAASAIGANGLFCRVATQYHDVGKLSNPQYFTENQLGGIDMHQLLTPMESTHVILSHVSEGVALARKVGLPEKFIDIIKEHHGNSLVCYFFYKQLELCGGDKSKVNENDFRYSGPKPHSKESTIIMIADAMEAASRSLDLFNEETLTDLMDSIISQKMEDGQLEDSLLTFEELNIIKKTLIKTLLAASHPRVKYPVHNPGEEG